MTEKYGLILFRRRGGF